MPGGCCVPSPHQRQLVKRDLTSLNPSHPSEAAFHRTLPLALLTSLIAFTVYISTLAPDLTWAHTGTDGGELITATVTLGVPHPPGYPTYVLLGKLFSILPFGSVAYRFNLFSAVAIAIAAGLVTLTSYRFVVPAYPFTLHNLQFTIHNSRLGPLATGLAFAFAPLIWSQAVITEVYGLNLAFVAAFLWLLLARQQPPLSGKQEGLSLRPLFTGWLLGLSFTTHLTSLLLLPLALAMTPWREWPQLGIGVTLGVLPWLALPWLSQTGSPVVWGQPTTLSGWWWLVSGRIYQPNIFALPAERLWPRLYEWGPLLWRQFTWLGFPLIAVTFLWPAPKQGEGGEPYRSSTTTSLKPGLRSSRFWLLGTAVLYILYAFGYNTPDAAVFLLPALLILALLLGDTLQRLGPAALLLPLASLLLNFTEYNLSHDMTVRPLAHQLLHTAPPDAILLTPGDQTIFTLWYFQHVEGLRPDVILIDENLFAFDWYRRRLQHQYPDLLSLQVDDIPRFVSANERGQPVVRVSLAR